MANHQSTLDRYLNRELRYWKGMKAVLVNSGGKSAKAAKVLTPLKGRFNDDLLRRVAEKRYSSLRSIVSLFQAKHRKTLVERLNKELGTKFNDVPTFADILKQKPPSDPRGTLAWGWVEIAVVIVIVIIVIVAEANDNNGVQEDDTVIVTVGTAALAKLVDTSSYLPCDEVATLTYEAWTTYLLLTKAMDPTGAEYLKALICAKCENLRTFVAGFNNNHDLILGDGVTFLGAFFYAAKLEECGIPY